MSRQTKRNTIIAIIIGLIIGVLYLIGNAVSDDGAPPDLPPVDTGLDLHCWASSDRMDMCSALVNGGSTRGALIFGG